MCIRDRVEELPLRKRLAALAHALAELTRLAEDLFMRDRPRSARDWERQQQQYGELVLQRNGQLRG